MTFICKHLGDQTFICFYGQGNIHLITSRCCAAAYIQPRLHKQTKIYSMKKITTIIQMYLWSCLLLFGADTLGITGNSCTKIAAVVLLLCYRWKRILWLRNGCSAVLQLSNALFPIQEKGRDCVWRMYDVCFWYFNRLKYYKLIYFG